MQHHNAAAVRRLRHQFAQMRGLWPGFEIDLQRMGISDLADLRKRDPAALAADYCRLLGRPSDRLLTYCFAAMVRFAETGEPVPWWYIVRDEDPTEAGAKESIAPP